MNIDFLFCNKGEKLHEERTQQKGEQEELGKQEGITEMRGVLVEGSLSSLRPQDHCDHQRLSRISGVVR